jgi:hypothetical protein
MTNQKAKPTISRRNFLGTTATAAAAISISPLAFSCSAGDSGS